MKKRTRYTAEVGMVLHLEACRCRSMISVFKTSDSFYGSCNYCDNPIGRIVVVRGNGPEVRFCESCARILKKLI